MASRPIWAAAPIAGARGLCGQISRRTCSCFQLGLVVIATIADALAEWSAGGRRNAIIRISTIAAMLETIALDFDGATGNTFAIEAADGAGPISGSLRLCRSRATGPTLP